MALLRSEHSCLRLASHKYPFCVVGCSRRVGDTLRYGSSSRLFVFGGPAELMPEEGLTRRQKQQLAALQYAQKAKEQVGVGSTAV